MENSDREIDWAIDPAEKDWPRPLLGDRGSTPIEDQTLYNFVYKLVSRYEDYIQYWMPYAEEHAALEGGPGEAIILLMTWLRCKKVFYSAVKDAVPKR